MPDRPDPPERSSRVARRRRHRRGVDAIARPAIAGVLSAAVGVIGCLIVNAASNILFVVVALWILRITFCPVLVQDAFAGDAVRFSLVIAAFGIGGLSGAVVLLAIDPARDRRRVSSWCAVGSAVLSRRSSSRVEVSGESAAISSPPRS